MVKVGDYRTTTDTQGNFQLPVPAAQEVKLSFEKIGFITVDISITVSQSTGYEFSTRLQPRSPGPDYTLRYFTQLITK
jgi:hypothetical protein